MTIREILSHFTFNALSIEWLEKGLQNVSLFSSLFILDPIFYLSSLFLYDLEYVCAAAFTFVIVVMSIALLT